jgi:putative transcriptional regulator
MSETNGVAVPADEPKRQLLEKIAGEVVLSDDAGETLRKWREDFGVSQSDLSEHLGVSSSVISDYESGRRESPGIRIVRRMAEALIALDEERGGHTLQRYRRILGAGFEGDAVKDLQDYETPVAIDELYGTIEAETAVPTDASIKGHTVIDSLEAITTFSGEGFARLYGWSTERVLVFTGVTRGESPLVAIRVTNLKPSAVVLHGIEADDISPIAPKIADMEGIGLATTTMDLDELLDALAGGVQ